CTGQAPAAALNPQLYRDPSGIYALPYPEGWSYSVDAESTTVTFQPADISTEENGLFVKVFAAPTFYFSGDEASQETNAILEDFLKNTFGDSAYEIYSSGETKVDREPALILDIAEPLEDGYMSGRMVLVYMRGYALGIAGSGSKEAWDAFLPTFTKMVSEVNIFPED
ncbi:MAG: hypothetical protein ABIG43_00180, partial [Chloroflexota bacterium]